MTELTKGLDRRGGVVSVTARVVSEGGCVSQTDEGDEGDDARSPRKPSEFEAVSELVTRLEEMLAEAVAWRNRLQ